MRALGYAKVWEEVSERGKEGTESFVEIMESLDVSHKLRQTHNRVQSLSKETFPGSENGRLKCSATQSVCVRGTGLRDNLGERPNAKAVLSN